MAQDVRLTREGHERLKASLEQAYERLDEATRILRELTGTTDDYDDSGLEEAKREKARIEQNIDKLESQLERAVIIEAHQLDKVDLGAVITLQDTKTHEDFEVQLVSPVEAGVLEGDIPRISDESPLGKALMGRKAGETFEVTIGKKTNEYTVLTIG